MYLFKNADRNIHLLISKTTILSRKSGQSVKPNHLNSITLKLKVVSSFNSMKNLVKVLSLSEVCSRER